MSCYLSFLDKEVFKGVTPPEEMSTTLVKEAKHHSIMARPAATSKEKAAKKASQKPAQERKCPKFPRWEKVLHPSQPLVVAGQPPHLLRSLEQTYPLMADHGLPTKIAPMKTPSPLQELEAAHPCTSTPSFLEVTRCLRDPLPKEILDTTLIPVAVGIMTALGVVTMSASHVVLVEATGVTYLNTVTTSIGRVTLSGHEHEIPALGPKIEDVTDLI